MLRLFLFGKKLKGYQVASEEKSLSNFVPHDLVVIVITWGFSRKFQMYKCMPMDEVTVCVHKLIS